MRSRRSVSMAKVEPRAYMGLGEDFDHPCLLSSERTINSVSDQSSAIFDVRRSAERLQGRSTVAGRSIRGALIC